MESIRTVDLSISQPASFRKHLADCVIVTHDKRILLQKRPDNWGTYAGVVNLFGGHVEKGESATQAVIREIAEETGGIIAGKDLIFVAAVSEAMTGHSELVHIHFWHDRHNTITGCYEAEAIHYPNIKDAIANPKIMDYARWALEECERKGLLPAL